MTLPGSCLVNSVHLTGLTQEGSHVYSKMLIRCTYDPEGGRTANTKSGYKGSIKRRDGRKEYGAAPARVLSDYSFLIR